MINIRYIFYFVACILVLTSCSADQPEGERIDSFSFVDQNEQSFGMDDLTGSVWVANFVFTNCETVCPRLTSEMAALQNKFAEEGIQAEFVSFTVDPEVDSPEVLKEYIGEFTNNETNWHMLTGYTQKEIEIFAREQFQTIVQKPSSSNQVLHGTNFYLVDDEGFILNEYNYVDSTYVKEMIEDITNINL